MNHRDPSLARALQKGLTMSLARTVAVAALTTAALVAVSRDAHAAVGTSFGKELQSSSYSDGFGAGIDFYVNAGAVDNDATCAALQTACKSHTASPFACSKDLIDKACSVHGFTGHASGGASADLTLFDKDLSLIDFTADVSMAPTGGHAAYSASVIGWVFASKSWDGALSYNQDIGSHTLMKVSTQFMLGPVPLTVSASATGDVSVDFELTPGTSMVSGGVTPGLAIDGVLSAGVGTSGFSAGVEGDLNFVTVSVPATGSLTFLRGGAFGYDAKLDLDIDALSGHIDLYADAFSKHYTKQIFAWDGVHWNHTIDEKQGTFTLGSGSGSQTTGNGSTIEL